MWDWTTSNLITVLLLAAFLGTLCYAVRLRSRMAASKAHFAFVSSATLASCFFAQINFLSGSRPIWIGNKILSGAAIITGGANMPISASGIGWLAVITSGFCTTFALYFIYRFCVQAIRHWDGPVTVTVNELVKQDLDKSFPLLALAELRRLVTRRPDPIASDAALNWQ